MTDKPIIFSAPMIRALLEGRKTQTRRITRKQDWPAGVVALHPHQHGAGWAVGDRLWVREAWRTFVSLNDLAPVDLWPRDCKGVGIAYEAGGGMSITASGERRVDYALEPRDDMPAFGRLRAAMHMPRWASRLTLTVSEVRVQRLQDITDDDAKAEGVKPQHGAGEPHVAAYADLWAELHGSTSWSGNPFVAALTFTVERRNIDAAEAT